MTKKYRRACRICRKKFTAADKRVHVCQDNPECQKEIRRIARVRHAVKYKSGGEYYYYRKKNREEVIAVSPVNEDIKMRACLGVNCNGEKTFLSMGAHNRICKSCLVAYDNYTERNKYVVRSRAGNSWREHF